MRIVKMAKVARYLFVPIFWFLISTPLYCISSADMAILGGFVDALSFGMSGFIDTAANDINGSRGGLHAQSVTLCVGCPKIFSGSNTPLPITDTDPVPFSAMESFYSQDPPATPMSGLMPSYNGPYGG